MARGVQLDNGVDPPANNPPSLNNAWTSDKFMYKSFK